MTEETLAIEQKRYPIGHFQWGQEYSEEDIQKMIETIENFPSRLKTLVSGIKEQYLDTPYRESGWTVRQVVHHVADSHMNAYIRFKLALTEDKPTIKPYNEKAWAELIDSKTLPVSVSLGILAGVHERWTTILKAMDEESYQRTFFHPENMKMHTLLEILAMYAWHCNHHYEHINLVKQQIPAPAKATKKKSEPKKAVVKLSAEKKSKVKTKS
ncbi:MAG: YfiT family bacillithiol transferase [Chitinophagales bacterium]